MDTAQTIQIQWIYNLTDHQFKCIQWTNHVPPQEQSNSCNQFACNQRSIEVIWLIWFIWYESYYDHHSDKFYFLYICEYVNTINSCCIPKLKYFNIAFHCFSLIYWFSVSWNSQQNDIGTKWPKNEIWNGAFNQMLRQISIRLLSNVFHYITICPPFVRFHPLHGAKELFHYKILPNEG